MRTRNKVVANALDSRVSGEAALVKAYKETCLKAAEKLQTAFNEFDGAYTGGARIAQYLPKSFTDKYLEIVGAKLPLRLFIAQCRQPL